MKTSALRLKAVCLTDLRLQLRHGFYAAYAVVTAIYAVALHQLARVAGPETLRAVAATLIFTDPATLGAFFVGGLVLLEKQQGSLTAAFVTPLRLTEYLLSKAVSLTALATATSLVVALASGLQLRPVPLVLGVVATSVLFIMLGLAVVARVRTVNGYLLATIPVAVIPMLPALRFLGLESGLLWLVPTRASIRLLEAGLGGLPQSPAEMLYAAVVLPAACVAAGAWARRRFARHILGERL
ncbi:MAG: ABC transporter permease [Spirochaetia bacterium]